LRFALKPITLVHLKKVIIFTTQAIRKRYGLLEENGHLLAILLDHEFSCFCPYQSLNSIQDHASVAIGEPARQARKASHCGSKQQ